MQITPQQEALVRAWAAEGATLSDIQTRLADECGLRLSYLDTRFLLLDLKVDLVEKTKKEPPPPDSAPPMGKLASGASLRGSIPTTTPTAPPRRSPAKNRRIPSPTRIPPRPRTRARRRAPPPSRSTSHASSARASRRRARSPARTA